MKKNNTPNRRGSTGIDNDNPKSMPSPSRFIDKGVKNAIQYTIPIEEALKKVRSGENPTLSASEKHLRECFVAIEDGADASEIEKQIVTMPNYFADYKTIVHFVSDEEVKKMQEKLLGFVHIAWFLTCNFQNYPV